jgi:hypothetical protein
MNAERIEELRKWLALHVQWLKSPVPTPNGDTIKMWTRDYRENMADLLSLLDEAASLAGQPAAPAKPRVSREWLRWQAGEIWSAKTIDDAMDTLADTLKGFGVEVDGAA